MKILTRIDNKHRKHKDCGGTVERISLFTSIGIKYICQKCGANETRMPEVELSNIIN